MNSEWNQLAVHKKPPAKLLMKMRLPVKTLAGPGPTNCSERVLKALQNQMIGHLHPEICQLMDEIKAGMQYAFQTKNRLTLVLSASGHGGMEACLGNLLEPGETIVIVRCGIWGERAADIASRIGANVELIETEHTKPVTMDQLESALKTHKPVAVFMVHAESSTGLRQPLEGVGDLVHKYDALLIVDVVASLGGEPFFMDSWGVDAAYTASQKVLGAPPGLAPLSFSPRADVVAELDAVHAQRPLNSVLKLWVGNTVWVVTRTSIREKLFRRKTKPFSFYWDLNVLGVYWKCFGNEDRVYHHTVSATLLYGLREALAEMAEESLPVSWARHAAAAARLRKGLEARGLKLYVKIPRYQLSTVTSVELPPGVDGNIIVQRAMERYKVEISKGLGPTVGKILRIGLLGSNATSKIVDLVLRALDEGLRHATASKL